MHQNILPFMEMLYFIPCKNFIFRQCRLISHYFIFLFSFFLINKVAYQHIQCCITADNFPQCFENLHISTFFYPIIAVYNLKIKPCCMLQACINRRAMSTVFFVNCLDNAWIHCLIFVSNGGRLILRSIINN